MMHAFVLSTTNHLTLFADIIKYFDINRIQFVIINLKSNNTEKSDRFLEALQLNRKYIILNLENQTNYFNIRVYLFNQFRLTRENKKIEIFIRENNISKFILGNDIGFFEKCIIRYGKKRELRTFLVEEGFVDYHSRNSFLRRTKYFITRNILSWINLDHYGSNKYGGFGVDYILCKSKRSLDYFNRIKMESSKLLLVGYGRIKDKATLLFNIETVIQGNKNILAGNQKKKIIFFTSGLDGQMPDSELILAEKATINRLFDSLTRFFGEDNVELIIIPHVDSNKFNFRDLNHFERIVFYDKEILLSNNILCFTFFSSVIYELAYRGLLVFWVCFAKESGNRLISKTVFTFKLFNETKCLVETLGKYLEDDVKTLYLRQNTALEQDVFMTNNYNNDLIGDTINYL